MPDFKEMLLAQHGSDKVDGYPSILPPRDPPPPSTISSDSIQSRREPWWMGAWIMLEAAHIVSQLPGVRMKFRYEELRYYLIERMERLAKSDAST